MRPVLVLLALLWALPAAAEDLQTGEVRLALDRYDELVGSQNASPTAGGSDWAWGTATATVSVNASGGVPSATVSVTARVRVFAADTAVPVLPGAVALQAVRVDNSETRLTPSGGGLVWRATEASSFEFKLDYVVDAARSEQGWSLAIPLPPVPSTKLNATLPGAGLDAAAIPGSGVTISPQTSSTRLEATVPAAPGVQITWRAATEGGHSISRATYVGALKGEAVAWTADFSVDSSGGEAFVLPLLPTSVALVSLAVDGREAPVLVVDDRFATRLQGAGRSTVTARFEVPVERADGPPQVVMTVPPVPVSRFELTLPGDKKVTVSPAANVSLDRRGGRTVATVNVPMTSELTLTWPEAVPEAVTEEVRTNASIFHAAHAEEGVLYLRAIALMDVTRGETNQFELDLPPDVQINDVTGQGVADWRVKRSAADKPGVLSVFIDRKVSGEFPLEVVYERLLGRGDEADPGVPTPLLTARGAHRQLGMVALLASKELTLEPLSEVGLTRVGENQLPAFVKQRLEMTIAHTFKYNETGPTLVVRAATPERQDGRFDAQVNTLISLGDVSLAGAATVELNVKSGSLATLQVALPKGVNFLNLSAPSLRGHELKETDEGQVIDVEFTQELEGRFRVEVAYEQILGEAEGELTVPTLSVKGAEVEQGRIAVEALSAVEVQASTIQQLSSVDVSELPRQLVLRTTNPILLAYKYVHVDPPYRLGLKITRHRTIDVQAATIDDAHYSSLVTEDGLAVTTARFVVRNRREQFLRVRLPKGSTVWSATVSGDPEKPAEGDADGGRPEILIKIRNSEEGFPVELVYATPIPNLRFFGRIRGELPQPDMVVTQSRLDLYLPARLRYGKPRGTMEPTSWGGTVDEAALRASLGEDGPGPLRIVVPRSGVQYSFSKLYANQGDREVGVSIPYTTSLGRNLTSGLALLATLLFWGAAGSWARRRAKRPGNTEAGVMVGGVLIAGLLVGWLDVPTSGPVTLSLLILLGAAATMGGLRLRAHRAARGEDDDGFDDEEPGGGGPASPPPTPQTPTPEAPRAETPTPKAPAPETPTPETPTPKASTAEIPPAETEATATDPDATPGFEEP